MLLQSIESIVYMVHCVHTYIVHSISPTTTYIVPCHCKQYDMPRQESALSIQVIFATPGLAAGLDKLDDSINRDEDHAALVFGREESGLTAEEVSACTHCCSIPTGELQPSLNLSHAVAVVLAQLFEQVQEESQGAVALSIAKLASSCCFLFSVQKASVCAFRVFQNTSCMLFRCAVRLRAFVYTHVFALMRSSSYRFHVMTVYVCNCRHMYPSGCAACSLCPNQ